jgi:hypothetical protein
LAEEGKVRKAGRKLARKKATRKKAVSRKKTTFYTDHIRNAEKWKWNVVFGIPSLGQVRIEWALALSGLVSPMNFSMSRTIHPVGVINPLQYHVAEAQNAIVASVLAANPQWDWLLLLEDDVVPHVTMLTRFRKWIEQDRYPIVSGLYHLKSDPPEPMTFRGRGNGAYDEWRSGKPDPISRRSKLPPGIKRSEVVFCDGVPTGCLLISTKLLRVAWGYSEEQVLKRKQANGLMVDVYTRKIFETIREAGVDPDTGGYFMRAGTSDLEFCDRVMADKGRWMREAGYPEAARMKYPFPVDISIDCQHIDLASGRAF